MQGREEGGGCATRLPALAEMVFHAATSVALRAAAEEAAGETLTGAGELRVGLAPVGVLTHVELQELFRMAWRQDREATAGEMTSAAGVPPVV